MAEGAPKAPVVAEAHEVDTFRESFRAPKYPETGYLVNSPLRAFRRRGVCVE